MQTTDKNLQIQEESEEKAEKPSESVTGNIASNVEDIGNTRDVKYLEGSVEEYLVACVKYHQAILQISESIQEILSPVMLASFLTNEVMICVAAFQMTIDESNGQVKLFASLLKDAIYLLMICWCGEQLTEQSLTVNEVIYDSHWYNRSPKLKKMVQMCLMRSQKPVRLTAAKLFTVSLETFSDIFNKVYAYFTILRNMWGE
ncbi:putative odorant receptor 85d [Periplaneta americana]|uniref:putative odorant receptor 85d n=1 Tax=Periplaneta americana TaxID=6978 RepID=UPI0037E9522C